MEQTLSKELRMNRIFKAPVNLMWEVWTSPDHIANWWGPNGFTNTIHEIGLQHKIALRFSLQHMAKTFHFFKRT